MSSTFKANNTFSRAAAVATVRKTSPTTLVIEEFSANHDVGDYIVIKIGGTGIHPEAFTLHHPIGATRLDAGDWVATRTTDLHFLLSRREDPDGDMLKRRRDQHVLAWYVTQGHLGNVPDDPIYPTEKVGGVVFRNVRLAEAKRALDLDRAHSQEIHKKEQEGKPKAKKFTYGKVVQDFMSPDMRSYEAFLKSLTSESPLKEELFQYKASYVTRGGVGATEDQIPIPFVRTRTEADSLAAVVFQKLQQLFTKPSEDRGGGNSQPPAQGKVVDYDPGVEIDRLRGENNALIEKLAQLEANAQRHYVELQRSNAYQASMEAWRAKFHREVTDFSVNHGKKGKEIPFSTVFDSFPKF